MQSALRVGPAPAGDAAAPPGAHPAGDAVPFARARLSQRSAPPADSAESPVRVFADPDTAIPEVQLLSNGRYHVMVTNAGGGSSRWKDLADHAVARGRHHRQLGNVLLPPRRGAAAKFWSTAYQPTLTHGGPLRGDLLRGSRGVSAPGRRSRDAHRDRRVARRRYRGPPRPHHQPVAHRHGRSTSRAMRKSFSLLRPRTHCIPHSAISLCRPRFYGPPRDPLHAPPALARRAGAVDVPSDDGAWRRRARESRSRPTACASSAAAIRWPTPHAMTEPGRAVGHRRTPCWIRSRRSAIDHPRGRRVRRRSTW